MNKDTIKCGEVKVRVKNNDGVEGWIKLSDIASAIVHSMQEAGLLENKK